MDLTGVAGRRGRTALPKQIVATSSSLTKKARESSIGVKGAKIFNLLPVKIRNLDSNNVDTFKSALDRGQTDRGYKKTEPDPDIGSLLFVSFKRNRIF